MIRLLNDMTWMRVRRILQGIFGLIFFVTFCLHWQFERRFQFYPAAPDVSSGRVVPYEIQDIRYVTAEEYDRSWWLWRIALASMAVPILLQIVWPKDAVTEAGKQTR
ncbi:hypothetical protein [Inquilinus sp.]|jgi:hypothetical protein|uniref:hypothetical protein n=1 Tax=Inquilinus sp. TaxID=1932117 RepID=UPI003784DE68